MLTDNQLKETIDDIVSMYQDIEDEMLSKLGKFLDCNDEIGGSAEWHIKKLQEISNLNGDLVNTLSKYSVKSAEKINEMLEKASIANFVVDQAGRVTKEKILANAKIQEQIKNFSTDLGRNLAKIRTNTINETKQEYLSIVDKATLEVSSGVKSFTQSISDSLKDLGERGITGQLYERDDGSIVRYNIEGLVRRDLLTSAFSIANQAFIENAKENDENYVYVSQHLGARTSTKSKIANHAGWQGKIYRLEGKDDKFGNFYEETGAGQVEGFGGPNCRHRVTAANPDMKLPGPIDQSQNEKTEQLLKKQRYLERGLRSWKRKVVLLKYSNSLEEYKKAKIKMNEWINKLDQFTKENGLRRDYSRERSIYNEKV